MSPMFMKASLLPRSNVGNRSCCDVRQSIDHTHPLSCSSPQNPTVERTPMDVQRSNADSQSLHRADCAPPLGSSFSCSKYFFRTSHVPIVILCWCFERCS